jgi:3-hexulose-6-phosphate synthase
VRDEFRAADSDTPRLVFADILLPQQGPADRAIAVAEEMLDAGVDGVGLHLQHDARRADVALYDSSYLSDAALAVYERVGNRASVQVVGGLSIVQATALARQGLRAFVISGNMGVADGVARFGLPAKEIGDLVRAFIAAVSAARP